MFKNFSLIICSVLFMATLCGAEQTTKNAPHEKKNSFSITADRMEVLIGQVVRLEGNVIVADSKMEMYSDIMMVFMKNKEGAEMSQKDEDKEKKKDDLSSAARGIVVDRIEAYGHVKIQTLDGNKRSATGERGIYNKKDDILTLEGNCTLMTDGNVMNCIRVIYDRKNDRIFSDRATIVIPMDEKSGDNGDGKGVSIESLFGTTKSKEATKANEKDK